MNLYNELVMLSRMEIWLISQHDSWKDEGRAHQSEEDFIYMIGWTSSLKFCWIQEAILVNLYWGRQQ